VLWLDLHQVFKSFKTPI